MPQMYYDKDADLGLLKGKTIGVVGFGSQGHAHALNLKDSGCDVVVGVRKGGVSWKKARRDGLEVAEPSLAVAGADVIAMLVPDLAQKDLYQSIRKSLKSGATLLFAHGFNVHFRQIKPRPDLDVVLIAPKGPGDLVRRQYSQGRGVPCLLAVAQDASGKAHARALAYAHGIGGTRGGVLETSFAEETETDLFGEQAVLCGGLTELIRAGFETLVEAGYSPEMAYFECLHEVKLIVDLIYEGGIANMRYSISNTAEYGDMTRGKRVVGPEARQAMKAILSDIQSGKFADEWITEHRCGSPHFRELRKEAAQHPIEGVGTRLRSLMPWLASNRLVDRSRN